MPMGSYVGIFTAVVVIGSFAVVFGLVIPSFVRASWARWHDSFPPVPPGPDAVSRQFQSFSVGLLNLGYSVHVTVDAGHLHLRPTAMVRCLGMRSVSIPWDAVEFVGVFPFGRRRARVAGVSLIGPAWCLDLARARSGTP